jgi:hypothetical protein
VAAGGFRYSRKRSKRSAIWASARRSDVKKKTILCLLVILGAAALAPAQDKKEVSLKL